MTVRLAHQDVNDVVGYKRAGWWGDTTVGDYVDRWARERPDADAFVVDDARMSWFEYDARATRLATTLAATQLRREARVAVLLPDGAAVHVAFVAAERAGLTVVGIGHRAGEAEIRHLLTKTGAAAIVVQEPDESPRTRRSRSHKSDRVRRRRGRGASVGLRRRSPCRSSVRRRRPLPGQLHVGDHRAAEVRDAQPEPLDVLPPARGRRRRLHPG